jgi:hypothetical protein
MKLWMRLLLDPSATDLAGGGGGGGGGTPASSANPSASDGVLGDTTEVPSSNDDTTTTDDLGGPDSPTPAPTPTSTQNWQSIRDVARARGFNVGGEFGDDGAFLDHLLQRAQASQQSDFYARLGQQLAPHAGRLQQFLQQGQPQQPQQAETNPWEAPEFDDRWLQLVDRDPSTGIYIAKPGADPAYAAKVNAFAEWKQKFDRNPASVLNGMVEARAKAIADQQFDARFAARERESTVRAIVQENSQWLYQRGQDGAPVRDYLGQPMLSPVGSRYMHHLGIIRSMGVTDPRHQDTLAKQAVQAEHYASQAQAAAAKNGQANPQTRAATNNPPVNPIQTAPISQRRVHPHDTPESTAGKSLSDMMRAALTDEGVTDQDIYNSVAH